MASFSLAAILGVPVGLELSRWFSWRAPFFAVAALGLLLTVGAFLALPPLRRHLDGARSPSRARPRLLDPLTRLSLGNNALLMLGVFAIVPNISAFLQHNLGYPRERLGLLYLAGGAASFVASHLIGKLVDRLGATRIIVAGTLIFATAIWFGFVDPVSSAHVIYVFVLLMMSASVRGVPLHTLASRVPRPELRARFMSAQSTVQHVASAIGAAGATLLLGADAAGRLLGMQYVALAAIAISLLVPWLSFHVERGVLARERAG
jgi:predicted MFS family arabinose efflux permease